MSQVFSPTQVLCRPARERDLEQIREFCKTIWDGHDYVPDVIDDWFQDRRGIFAVAEYEDRAIACSKITWLAEGQWWLEGFRVDPKYQGRKVGSLLHGYVDQWWLERGNGVLRLMTSSKNKSVQHICESTGFTNLFEVRGYKAEPLDGQAEMFTSAAFNDKDLGPVVEFACRSPSLAMTNRVVDFGWQCVNPISPGALSDLFSDYPSFEKNILWWHTNKGLLIVWDDSDPEEGGQTMGIGVLACDLEDMSSLLIDARYLAAQQKKTIVFWLAPVQQQVQTALKQAGFSSDWDNTGYVFEKQRDQPSS